MANVVPEDRFPAKAWHALVREGGTRWAIARERGGDGLDALALHRHYERLARTSLAVAFVLTQHDSCAGYLAAGESPLADDRLAAFARGERLASVAISHLTTSRTGGVTATLDDDGAITLSGLAPWCTAAEVADDVAVAARTPDWRQVLVLVCPKQDAGVVVPPPPPIVALAQTRTGPVELRDVRLPRERLIAGPGDAVLGRRDGKLPIGQAFLALGHTAAAIGLIGSEDAATAERFAGELRAARSAVYVHSSEAGDAAEGDRIRGRTIALAQRACLAAVAVHKGAALVNGHPAQRLAREALFLLVWSCPGGVRDCTLAELTA